jgi:protein-disulfide isomerase
MAKRSRKSSRSGAPQRGTNWLVVGGAIFLGAVALFALLYLALREPETLALADFCTQNQENCITFGDENAPITLVEVSDFGCPHCRDFHQLTAPTLREQYVDSGLVKWVAVPYALRPETVPAANAAMCAAEQGLFVEFTEALYNQPEIEPSLTRDGFMAAAAEIGLETEAFSTCVANAPYNATIARNQDAARSARVTGTPTFFINNEIVRGALPLDEFERRFDQFLES